MTADSTAKESWNFGPEPKPQEELSPWEQFARAAVNQGYLVPRKAVTEIYDQAAGTHRADEIEITPLPEATNSVDENMQMLGSGLGTAGTIVLTAVAVRFGLGKVMSEGLSKASRSALPSSAADLTERVLTTRSNVGLNILDSAATGFTTGALLKPSDDSAKLDLKSFIEDRVKNGAADAMSFSAMTGANFALSSVSRSKMIAETSIGAFARSSFENPVSSGIISGIPGGVITAEANALSTTGQLTWNKHDIGQSIYQMSLVGGAFGGITAAQGKIGSIREAAFSAKEQSTASIFESAPNRIEQSAPMGLATTLPLEPPKDLRLSEPDTALKPSDTGGETAEKSQSVRARRRAERAAREQAPDPQPTNDPVVGATRILERLKKEEAAASNDQKSVPRRDALTVKEADAIVTLKGTPQSDEIVGLLSKRGDVSRMVATYVGGNEDVPSLNATSFGAIVDEVRRVYATKQMVETWKTQSSNPDSMQQAGAVAPAGRDAKADTMTVDEARKLRMMDKYSPDDALDMVRTLGEVRGPQSEFVASQILHMHDRDFAEFNLARLTELKEEAERHAEVKARADLIAKSQVSPEEKVTSAEALTLAQLSHSDPAGARTIAKAIGDVRGNAARWIADTLTFHDINFRSEYLRYIPSTPGYELDVEKHLDSVRRYSDFGAHAYDSIENKSAGILPDANSVQVSRADAGALELLRTFGPTDVLKQFEDHLKEKGPIGEFFVALPGDKYLLNERVYAKELKNAEHYVDVRKQVEQMESDHVENSSLPSSPPAHHMSPQEITDLELLSEVSPEYAERMKNVIARRSPEANFMANAIVRREYGTGEAFNNYANAYAQHVVVLHEAQNRTALISSKENDNAEAAQPEGLTPEELDGMAVFKNHRYVKLDAAGNLADVPQTNDSITKQELQALTFFMGHPFSGPDYSMLKSTLIQRGQDSQAVVQFLEHYNPQTTLTSPFPPFRDDDFILLRNAAALLPESLRNLVPGERDDGVNRITQFRSHYDTSQQLGPLPKHVAINFGHVRETIVDSEPSSKRFNAAAIIQMAGRKEMTDLPKWAVKPVYDHIDKVDVPTRFPTEEEQALRSPDEFGPVALTKDELVIAAKAWQVDPTMPVELALRTGELDARTRLSVGVAWKDMLIERGATSDGNPYSLVNRALSLSDWKHLHSDPAQRLADAERAHQWLQQERESHRDSTYLRESALRLKLEQSFYDALDNTKTEDLQTLMPRLWNKQAIAVATEALYPKLEDRSILNSALQATENPFILVPHVRLKEFHDAYKYVTDEQAKSGAVSAQGFAQITALRVSNVFDQGWMNWLKSQQSIGRNTHDATFWLSEQPPDAVTGLADALRKNGSRPIHELEVVSSRWSEIPEDKRTEAVSDLYIFLQSKAYKDAKNLEFAAEAGRWAVSPKEYEEIERRFEDSKNTPSAFPMDKRWTENELTGRFIPRNDPRGVFLGKHTNCCQHPGGAGASSAWHGQEDPRGGYFVVEDKQGIVVAQSWAWIGDDGNLVFDNIEGKGIEARQNVLKDVYKKAADELSAEFPLVTVGMAHTTIDFSHWQRAGAKTVSLPSDYSGYTDAREQAILAENESAKPIHKREGLGPKRKRRIELLHTMKLL